MQTPLLSNLDIVENIALIKEVHEGYSREAAHALAEEALESFDYGHISRLRSVNCNDGERFIAQLLRATMTQYDKIVIVRPFVMLRDTVEMEVMGASVYRIAQNRECIVLDMRSNRSKYEAGGEMCHIIG